MQTVEKDSLWGYPKYQVPEISSVCDLAGFDKIIRVKKSLLTLLLLSAFIWMQTLIFNDKRAFFKQTYQSETGFYL